MDGHAQGGTLGWYVGEYCVPGSGKADVDFCGSVEDGPGQSQLIDFSKRQRPTRRTNAPIRSRRVRAIDSWPWIASAWRTRKQFAEPMPGRGMSQAIPVPAFHVLATWEMAEEPVARRFLSRQPNLF